VRVLIFSVLTVAIWTVGYVVYNQAVLRKQATPSLGFWFTIAVVDWVTLLSLLGAGVRNLGLTQVAVWTVGASVTCFLTWRRHGQFVLDRVEIACLLLTLAGLFLWMWIGNPKASVAIQVIAFTVSMIPFWRNALKGRERWQAVVPSLCGALASLGTLTNFSLGGWVSFAIPLLGVILNCVSLATSYAGIRFLSPKVI
jgi:hypothetical protein